MRYTRWTNLQICHILFFCMDLVALAWLILELSKIWDIITKYMPLILWESGIQLKGSLKTILLISKQEIILLMQFNNGELLLVLKPLLLLVIVLEDILLLVILKLILTELIGLFCYLLQEQLKRLLNKFHNSWIKGNKEDSKINYFIMLHKKYLTSESDLQKSWDLFI